MIYLASTSERRRELLAQAKIPFKVVSSTYRERSNSKLLPAALVMKHAVGKAQKAKILKRTLLVLGSDTIVVYKKRVYGKPKTKKEASKMLQTLQGKTHEVFSGVCFWNPKEKKGLVDFDVTRVTMKRLSVKQIKEYHEEVNPLDKAGSYAIQTGPKIVAKIQGSYSNVVGLPMELVKRMLKKIKSENE